MFLPIAQDPTASKAACHSSSDVVVVRLQGSADSWPFLVVLTRSSRHLTTAQLLRRPALSAYPTTHGP
jgi:hypothetical protein